MLLICLSSRTHTSALSSCPELLKRLKAHVIYSLLTTVRYENIEYRAMNIYFKQIPVRNVVFLDVTSCGSCRNRRFGRTYRLLSPGRQKSAPSLVTFMKETILSRTRGGVAICLSETSVVTTATRHNIPEDDILHSHCGENLKSYIALSGWTL
jgi:hypothetical protein